MSKSKQKTHKTISKRVHVTASNKIILRSVGQDHFNARASGNAKRNKRRDRHASDTITKNIKRFI